MSRASVSEFILTLDIQWAYILIAGIPVYNGCRMKPRFIRQYVMSIDHTWFGWSMFSLKNAAALSTELVETSGNYSLGKLEKRIRQADLLILDELSYISFNRYQSELLFKEVSDRSERVSVIVTTNLPFSKWTDLFENTTMVAALVDRLTFKSYVLDMNGDSYRLEQLLKNR